MLKINSHRGYFKKGALSTGEIFVACKTVLFPGGRWECFSFVSRNVSAHGDARLKRRKVFTTLCGKIRSNSSLFSISPCRTEERSSECHFGASCILRRNKSNDSADVSRVSGASINGESSAQLQMLSRRTWISPRRILRDFRVRSIATFVAPRARESTTGARFKDVNPSKIFTRASKGGNSGSRGTAASCQAKQKPTVILVRRYRRSNAATNTYVDIFAISPPWCSAKKPFRSSSAARLARSVTATRRPSDGPLFAEKESSVALCSRSSRRPFAIRLTSTKTNREIYGVSGQDSFNQAGGSPSRISRLTVFALKVQAILEQLKERPVSPTPAFWCFVQPLRTVSGMIKTTKVTRVKEEVLNSLTMSAGERDRVLSCIRSSKNKRLRKIKGVPRISWWKLHLVGANCSWPAARNLSRIFLFCDQLYFLDVLASAATTPACSCPVRGGADFKSALATVSVRRHWDLCPLCERPPTFQPFKASRARRRKDASRFGRKRVSRSNVRAKKQAPKYTPTLADCERLIASDSSIRVPCLSNENGCRTRAWRIFAPRERAGTRTFRRDAFPHPTDCLSTPGKIEQLGRTPTSKRAPKLGVSSDRSGRHVDTRARVRETRTIREGRSKRVYDASLISLELGSSPSYLSIERCHY